MQVENARVAVLGLGYVGLPLAVEFGRRLPVVGFDINTARISELRSGRDHTLEVSAEELVLAEFLSFTNDPSDLKAANTYIITTPTPVDEHKRPDLGPVLAASKTVASVLKSGDVVIYESTVYPGATEEDCVPLLVQGSGLEFNTDFFVGYSPERINPGDKEHRLPTITKVTSGSTAQSARYVDDLYRTIITAGTHLASSIRVAEAAKVIENTQRDVNIALMNELAVLFSKLGIDTLEVLEAAGTKWNFLGFRPGLVGGHCIGVDPYYLTHKAQAVGHNPEIILAGRRLNDAMGAFVVGRLVKEMAKRGLPITRARVLIMGLTFKEGTPDLRNSKVVDIIAELESYDIRVDVTDPWADPEEAQAEYGIGLVGEPELEAYDAVILAVAHPEFAASGGDGPRKYGKPGGEHVIYDLKGVIAREMSDLRL